MKLGKNRYYRRSRISESRFRRLLRAFALDLTATDAAQLTGLSGRRINDIYLKVRRRIAERCEQPSAFRSLIDNGDERCPCGQRRFDDAG